MAKEEKGIRRNEIIKELVRSSHGNLTSYIDAAQQAAREDPEFTARLIAWNHEHGEVRDSKVALPVITVEEFSDKELAENSAAHLALLSPRDLNRALDFAKAIRVAPRAWKHWLRPMVEGYLRAREKNWAWWERTVLTHRKHMKSLYARWHVKPSTPAQAILFDRKYPRGTVFADIKRLAKMEASEAARVIVERKVPFLVAVGAMGEKAKDTKFVSALIDSMSPAEVMNNTKLLEKLGVKTVPELRAAFEAALKRTTESRKGKVGSLKAAKAAEMVTDRKVKEQLLGVQDKKVKAMGVKGRWLVLGDKSGSMERSIEISRLVASTLAAVAEEVHLVFFDVSPTYYPVSGKSYDQILETTKRVVANGGTSIGCGLASIMARGIEVDGIAIVSDAQENTPPFFAEVYQEYSKRIGKEVPIYLYRCEVGSVGWADHDVAKQGLAIEEFDLRGQVVDRYSLPNLVQTMRTNKYSLADEIMETPLLKLEEALKQRKVA